jgi:hypothetical protein
MTDTLRVLIPVLFLSVLEVFEFFAVHKEGSDVFAPKLGWRLFYFVLVAAGLIWLSEGLASAGQTHDKAQWVDLLVLFVFVIMRPKTVVVSSAGLASYGLYGFRRRFIPWVEVARVSSNWQEEGYKFWVFMGYGVTVTGRDGTRIEHSIYLRRQGRLLDDLRQHVPATEFDPGLFDWHP